DTPDGPAPLQIDPPSRSRSTAYLLSLFQCFFSRDSRGWRRRGNRPEDALATGRAVGPLRRQDPRVGAPALFSGICGAGGFGVVGRRYGRPTVPDPGAKFGLEALWHDVKARLRDSLPPSTFQLWIEPLEVAGARGNVLYLAAPDNVRAWSERRYSSLIRE